MCEGTMVHVGRDHGRGPYTLIYMYIISCSECASVHVQL